MVYLEGLNGHQMPVIMTLPESLSNGLTILEGETTFLQVDHSQSTTQEQEPKALSPGGGLSPTLEASPTRAFPPKVEGQISMTMEVSELLSWVALDTSGLASRSSNPKRPESLALATLLPLKLEDSARLVDTSSEVGTQEDAVMVDPMLEEIHVSLPLLVKTPGPSGEAFSIDVTKLQEEANKALGGHLLATRSVLNAQQRKQVSDFGMALYQTESETTETIKETKALCAHTIWDAKIHQTALISEAKVWHATCIKKIEDDYACALAEAENCCSAAIRKADSSSASKACSIQQSYTKDIQHLEAEAIE